MQLHDSWKRAWTNLGADPKVGLFERLVLCYGEPHRHYHTLQHLGECIEKLTPVLPQAEHPGEIELALWFHDSVYNPTAKDNELQSALWAKEAILAARSASTDLVAAAGRVHSLILDTQHASLPTAADGRLLVDIDLSILGAPADRFDEYERQVRDEYDWVADEQFRSARRAILQKFFDRESIFSTEFFRTQLEAQARENLLRSICSSP